MTGHGTQGGAHAAAYEQAKQALLAQVLPIYNSVKDPQQQVAFVTSMVTHGPRVMPRDQPGAGLQILDFPGMSNDTYGHYAQQPFDPATVTYGGQEIGASALPVGQFWELVKEARALGAK